MWVQGCCCWNLCSSRLTHVCSHSPDQQKYNTKLFPETGNMDPLSDEQNCTPTDSCLSFTLSKRSSYVPLLFWSMRRENLTKPCFLPALTFDPPSPPPPKPQKPSAYTCVTCVKRSALRAFLLSSCCPVQMLRCNTRALLWMYVCTLLIQVQTPRPPPQGPPRGPAFPHKINVCCSGRFCPYYPTSTAA